MVLDDHAMEVLRRSGERVAAGSAETYLRVMDNWVLQKVGNSINVSYPTDTTEVYVYVQDGDPVFEITVGYVDDTKEQLQSIERTA